MKQNWLLSVILMVCVVVLVVGLMPIRGEAVIYETVVRLHVLANSDSEEDQALKLRVRDAVLEVTGPLLDDCKTQDEAKALIESHFPEIQAAAEGVIADAGKSYPITLLLDMEKYPERDYDGFCFPAGEYLSLRVCIGEAAGQNWWCCLFPPLCRGAAGASPKEAEDAFVSVGLTPDQYKVITETERPVYKVRFKLLELFRR
jgi:stage II sporulation protein R